MLFEIPDTQHEPSQGKLLISEPFLADAHFKRTVILLSEHNTKGTVGFILNRPSDLKITEALDDFPEFDAPLYIGGPVQQDVLQFVHRMGDKIEGSVKIAKGIYWGGDFENVRLMIETGQITPDDIRFFIGYAGWDPNQLSDEISQKTWIISNKPEKFVFENPNSDLWHRVLKSMGSQYKFLSNVPEDPSLN